MDGIFISYRRDDSAGFAGRLYDRMVAHFGVRRVFMDVEGIEPGVDFVNAIEDAVASCRVLIVIIGDEWTRVTDASGRRRLDDPNDFIRLETGVALKRGIRVVPVLVDGAAMPRSDELPEELQALTRRQAVEISHKQWDASTGELIRTLERILQAAPVADAPHGRTASRAAVASAPAATPAATPAGDDRSRWLLPATGIGTVVVLLGALWFSTGKRDDAASPDSGVPELAAPAPVADAGKRDGGAPAAAAQPAPEGRPDKPVVAAVDAPTTKPVPALKPEPAPVATPAPKPQVVAAPAQAPKLEPAPAPKPSTAPAVAGAPVEQPVLPPAAEVPRPPPPQVREALAKSQAGETRPAESAVTLPAPLAVAPPAAAPTVKPSPATVGGLPASGNSWTYRSFGRWPTSPKRSFQIVVQSVANGVVTDTMRMIDPAGVGAEVRRSRSGKPDFVAWPEIGIEFSPYLGAAGDLARMESQSGLPTPDLYSQWSDWHSSVKWLGQETVSVPAGTFNCHKIEVWSNRHATGTRAMRPSEPVRVHYYVWYSPEVKRYVKMQRSIMAASGGELEDDVIELVARAP